MESERQLGGERHGDLTFSDGFPRAPPSHRARGASVVY